MPVAIWLILPYDWFSTCALWLISTWQELVRKFLALWMLYTSSSVVLLCGPLICHITTTLFTYLYRLFWEWILLHTPILKKMAAFWLTVWLTVPYPFGYGSFAFWHEAGNGETSTLWCHMPTTRDLIYRPTKRRTHKVYIKQLKALNEWKCVVYPVINPAKCDVKNGMKWKTQSNPH